MMTMGIAMGIDNHTTHYDDCGCKSARYEARIAAPIRENERLTGVQASQDEIAAIEDWFVCGASNAAVKKVRILLAHIDWLNAQPAKEVLVFDYYHSQNCWGTDQAVKQLKAKDARVAELEDCLRWWTEVDTVDKGIFAQEWGKRLLATASNSVSCGKADVSTDVDAGETSADVDKCHENVNGNVTGGGHILQKKTAPHRDGGGQ